MGIIRTKLKIINPDNPKKIFEGDFLVDTGAKYTVLPKNIWQKLGLLPERQQNFSLADGTTISRAIGNAEVEYQNRHAYTPVVLGEEKDSPLLGVITLENLGFAISPFTREIYPDIMMTL